MMIQQFKKIGSSLILFGCCLLTACATVSGGPAPTSLPTPNASSGPAKIALLLPMSGQFAGSAQTIKNGFFAAYYAAKQNSPNTPSVTVIDSSKGIRAAYQQAINSGATQIVGPLSKSQVAELASSGDVPVTTIALNSLDGNRIPTNLFQYSLSLRDEAIQAAERANRDGYKRVIIIAPANAWGQSTAAAFAQRWQSLGGQVADSLAFSSTSTLTSGIGNVLHAPTIAEQRKMMKDKAKGPIPVDQMRRQDFDVIFLVGTPQQARLIRPLLKFYYAGNIPVYATSSIYTGHPSPQTDRDLNGIIFCDMPWILTNQLPSNIASIKASSAGVVGSNSKLFAFGADAYLLINNLYRLSSSPSTGIGGATGTLYMGPQHQIQRQLLWARIQNGVPVIY